MLPASSASVSAVSRNACTTSTATSGASRFRLNARTLASFQSRAPLAIQGSQASAAVREFLANRRRDQLSTIKDRLARGVTDGDLTAPPASLDAIARYYTTVVQGLSIQARDGADRAELETVITCAMAAWDTLTSAPSHPVAAIVADGGSAAR